MTSNTDAGQEDLLSVCSPPGAETPPAHLSPGEPAAAVQPHCVFPLSEASDGSTRAIESQRQSGRKHPPPRPCPQVGCLFPRQLGPTVLPPLKRFFQSSLCADPSVSLTGCQRRAGPHPVLLSILCPYQLLSPTADSQMWISLNLGQHHLAVCVHTRVSM